MNKNLFIESGVLA